MLGRRRIEYKTPDQVRAMRRAGLVVASALAAVRNASAPGVRTSELDEMASTTIRAAGAQPSFLGYEGYPASVCVSVNDEVIHGIPGDRRLEAGDVVSLDCGAIVDGWHGDSACSFVLDDADDADTALVAATERAMWAGIAALAGEDRLGAVGAAVEREIAAASARDGARYGVVEDFVGHGIGTQMHQDPDVLNYVVRSRGPRLRAGMCLAVEPMITRGGPDVDVLDDDWTVVTSDGSRAAHWEHTVALLPGGIWVLTSSDGGASGLAPFGVDVVPLT